MTRAQMARSAERVPISSEIGANQRRFGRSNDPRSGAFALAIALFGIFARQVLMPWINTARDMQLQGNEEAKRRFSRLHGISVALN